MAIDCGGCLLWSLYGCIFFVNTCLLSDGGGEKTKKLYSGGQLVRDGGQLVTGRGRDAGGTGQGWRRPGGMSGGGRRSGGGGPGGGIGAG